MISDINLQIADSWTPTPSSGASAVNTTTVDLAGTALTAMTGSIAAGDALSRNISDGEPLYVVINILTAPTTATSVTFFLQTSTAADGTGSPVTFCTAPTIEIAQLPVGKQVKIRVDNPENLDLQRYLGLGVTAVGGAIAALEVDAFLVHGDQAGPGRQYPTSVVIPDSF